MRATLLSVAHRFHLVVCLCETPLQITRLGLILSLSHKSQFFHKLYICVHGMSLRLSPPQLNLNLYALSHVDSRFRSGS